MDGGGRDGRQRLDLARKALALAAGSPAAFKGKDEARKALAGLK